MSGGELSGYCLATDSCRRWGKLIVLKILQDSISLSGIHIQRTRSSLPDWAIGVCIGSAVFGILCVLTFILGSRVV